MASLAQTESNISKGTVASQLEHGGKHEPALGFVLEESELEGEDVDDNAKALKGQQLDFTEEEERRVLRKIDWRLMPLMAVCCGLQFVDKAAIGNAAVFGMKTDLNLKGQEYSWAVSIFYFGYLAATYPAIWAMQRFHAGRFIGINCILWGLSMVAMIATKNFAALAALRFLLGVFEACLSPGFTMITTRWYRQSEQPFRFGLWTLLNGWLPIPFLVFYYLIGKSEGGPLESWRYIFLMLGLITVICGVLVYFFLSDSPADVKWLDARERAIAVERVARSQTGLKSHVWKWSQCREALTDPVSWLLTMQMFLSQSGGSINTNFLGLVIAGFGYSQLRTILLQTPTFAIQGVVCLLVTGLATFTKTFRGLKQPMLSFASVFVITGAAVIFSNRPTDSNRNALLGCMYMIAINNCSFTTILSVIGSNTAGQTKKSTVNTMAFVAYCISNIVVPQSFLASEAPTYHSGIGTVLGFQTALFVCYWTSWLIMRRRNAARAAEAAALTSEKREEQDGIRNQVLQGLKDMTDRENKLFVYQG